MHDDAHTATDDAADERWIAGVTTGDDDAFIALYRHRRDDVYRFAFAMTRSRSFAQDTTQEVFLRVLEHAARYDARKGAVRAWLLGLARHVVIDRLRAERRWTAEAPEEAFPCENEQSVLTQQRLVRLHDAIARMPLARATSTSSIRPARSRSPASSSVRAWYPVSRRASPRTRSRA